MLRARPRAAERAGVAWHPSKPQLGDVAWLLVRDVPEGAIGRGLGRRPSPSRSFPTRAARPRCSVSIWRRSPGPMPGGWESSSRGASRGSAQGSRDDRPARAFPVERLTLPNTMVDLDPETERARGRREQAADDALPDHHARATLAGAVHDARSERPAAGTGFGARRIINGQPRSPHGGIDFSAPRGTPVVAVNAGKVALVAEFFFPGRLVILDHGLGLYTLYFHLDTIDGRRGRARGARPDARDGRIDRPSHRPAPALRRPGGLGADRPGDPPGPRASRLAPAARLRLLLALRSAEPCLALAFFFGRALAFLRAFALAFGLARPSAPARAWRGAGRSGPVGPPALGVGVQGSGSPNVRSIVSSMASRADRFARLLLPCGRAAPAQEEIRRRWSPAAERRAPRARDWTRP